jgi:uncharacterized protein YdeI (YjbR/CyaY-like superfamily)
MATAVDSYIAKHPQWRAPLQQLRALLNATELQETLKWGAPVYTLRGDNLVGLAAFKQYVGLWFFQGALLADARDRLINAQPGKTQALRQWRFAAGEVLDNALIGAYVAEAIALHKTGARVVTQAASLVLPAQLAMALAERPDLAENFARLAPYKQREFAEHIGGAKRAATQAKRLAGALRLIERGLGLNDKYRDR